MSKKFDTVAQLSAKGTVEGAYIKSVQDYARFIVGNDKNGIKAEVTTLSEQERKEGINKQFQSLLFKYAGKPNSAEGEFDRDYKIYASLDNVQKMAGMLISVATDAVTPIYANAMGLAMLAEFHYGGYNDSFNYEINDPSLFDVTRMGDRDKHTASQRKEKTNKPINTEFFGLTTITNLAEILSGESMVAEDIMKMALSMNVKLYTLVVEKFKEKTEAISDATLIGSGAFNEKSWMQKLKACSVANGSKCVILGDAIALKDVIPSTTALQILISDAYNTTLGYMDRFNTYQVVGFETTSNYDRSAVGLAENRIYGFPMGTNTKLIQVAVGATMSFRDEDDKNEDLSARISFKRQLGVDLVTTQKVARWNLA